MSVQLTGSELTCVWTHVDSGRILGFAPMTWTFAGSERCLAIPLYHAHEMDAWADRYRKQQREDFEVKQYETLAKDNAVRKRIREALRARRNVVGPQQRGDIDRGLRFLDALEAKLANRQQEGALLIERYDASKRSEDIALEAPAYQAPKLLTAGS